MHVRAILEAGEPRAGLTDTERGARVELDAEWDLEAEASGQLVQLGPGTEDRPLGLPHALGGVELDSRPSFANVEHPRLHQPLTDAARQALDRRPDVDRSAQLVEERLVLRRLENRKRAGLLLTPHQASRHPGCLERRRALGHVRPTYENALAAEQPRTQFVLEPLPLSPRPNRKPNEPLVVVPMPKDASAPGRLPRPGSGALEANELNAAPLERIRRGEPGDPGADDGDLCCRCAHGGPCIPPRLESHREGQ